MPRLLVFSLFYLATFLQSGTYGLTFMLPKLFAGFGANEKDVGSVLIITTVFTLFSVYYSGHLTDKFGRMVSLGISGFAISVSLWLFGAADHLGVSVVIASALLGFGWGVFYTLGPVVLSRITAPEERVRIFSLNSIFIMAGFGLSPVMVSLLESAGFAVSHGFLILAAVCVTSGIIFIFLRPAIRNLSLDTGTTQLSRLTVAAVYRVCFSSARLPVIMVFLGASVFAGLNNFQTVFAEQRELDYADFFLAYTVTVVVCRIVLAGFSGGKSPYLTIAFLQFIMVASVVLFIYIGGSQPMYIVVAILFGVGYGASYPILVAMAANDADKELVPQTLQFFALSYFVGIFAFPLVAGWIIVEMNTNILLVMISIMAFVEASMAFQRGLARKSVV